MTLKEAKIGSTVTVTKVGGEGALKRRIMDWASPRAWKSMCARWRRWAIPWKSRFAAMS